MRKPLLIALPLAVLLTAVAAAAPLDVVTVGAPAINCKYDADCTITVSDTTSTFNLPGASGEGFLQSRTFPPGEPGTAAAGRYGYQYRIDLTQMAGLTALPCVTSLSLDFGTLTPIDYDDDGNTDDVYVVTAGGLGNVAPSAADLTGTTLTLSFNPPICAGNAPGAGDTSYFIGLTSAWPVQDVTARITQTLGDPLDLAARAPAFTALVWPWVTPLVVVVIVVVILLGLWFWLRRGRRGASSRG
jgi:hypothetical protein